MFLRQVHPRSPFQKQFRTRSLRQQKAKRNFPSSPCCCSEPRFHAEAPCRGFVQRHNLFREIPCIADKKRRSFCGSMQRHTISRRKTRIATAGYRKSSGTMQRHTLFRKITCIADRKRRSFCGSMQRHTLSRRKTRIATAGYRKKEVRCSDTPFSAKFPVSRTGNCHSAKVPCSDTPFQEEKPVS